MKKTLLFTFIFISIFSQAQDVTLVLKVEDKIDTIFHSTMDNYETFYSSVDLTKWESLKDNGFIGENGFKQGKWIEYPIDTSILSKEYNIRNHPDKQEVYVPDLVKVTGNYLDGKKNENWEYYTGSGNTKMIFWTLGRTIEYKEDKKHGVEVLLKPFSKDTLIYNEYKNGKLDGVTEIFDGNGNIQMYGEMKNGNENGVIKRYFPNGQIEFEYNAENGFIVGECKYYNENGELQKVEIYEDGVLVETK